MPAFVETLFFITPIGEADSVERRRSDLIVSALLEPVCHDLGIQVIRADRIHESTSLLNKILQLVLEADYAVCDFAFGRPNVFYECGVRHATGKPILHLVREGDPLPFDVRDFMAIFVDETKPESFGAVQEQVRKMLLHSKEQRNSINPVTIAAKMSDVTISVRRATSRPTGPKPGAPSPLIDEDKTGRWLANFGQVRIRQSGPRLSGIYQYHSDRFLGVISGRQWQQWLLFEFRLKDSEVPGLAFLDSTAPDRYGYWLHSPAVPSLEDLQERLKGDLTSLLRGAKRWKLYGRVLDDGSLETVDRSMARPGSVAGFHLNQEVGPDGLTLREVLLLQDEDLEQRAGWLPWLFPDYGPEGGYPGLHLEEASTLRRSPEFQANLRKALVLMLRFYGFKRIEGASGVRVERSDQFEARKRDWVIVNHYHHARITRILRSLTVFGQGDEAIAFCGCLMDVQKTEYRHHLRIAARYWQLAVGLDRG